MDGIQKHRRGWEDAIVRLRTNEPRAWLALAAAAFGCCLMIGGAGGLGVSAVLEETSNPFAGAHDPTFVSFLDLDVSLMPVIATQIACGFGLVVVSVASCLEPTKVRTAFEGVAGAGLLSVVLVSAWFMAVGLDIHELALRHQVLPHHAPVLEATVREFRLAIGIGAGGVAIVFGLIIAASRRLA